MTSIKPQVQCLFHKDTETCTYVVQDPSSKHACIIDPVMDFDPAAVRTSQKHNEAVASYCEMENLQVDYIIETHVHADHMTGSEFLKKKFPQAKTAIGENVTKVQEIFKGIFNLKAKEDEFEADGTQFDLLLKDGQELDLGNLKIKVLYTPGHTPACVSLVIGDAVFTGDTIFMPDMGTARCDFPSGSVEALYNSIHRLYELPDETRVFVGHDYAPGGREYAWETTIGKSKESNKQIKADTPLEEFSEFRKARDASLKPPRLILPSLQINLRNGSLPPKEDNGISYLKMPMNFLGKDDHA